MSGLRPGPARLRRLRGGHRFARNTADTPGELGFEDVAVDIDGTGGCTLELGPAVVAVLG